MLRPQTHLGTSKRFASGAVSRKAQIWIERRRAIARFLEGVAPSREQPKPDQTCPDWRHGTGLASHWHGVLPTSETSCPRDPPALSASQEQPAQAGTGRLQQIDAGRSRFSPAQAGNSLARAARHCLPAVQPRAGGEQRIRALPDYLPRGSAPRRRGTAHPFGASGAVSRFSPAQAGNRADTTPRTTRAPVQPRAGGEQLGMPENMFCVTGSAPRRRGTGGAGGADVSGCRFSPAQAGNRRASGAM